MTDSLQSSTCISRPDILERIETLIEENDIVIFSKSQCPFCMKVKSLFTKQNKDFKHIELDEDPQGDLIQFELLLKTNQRTVPNVFIQKLHIGGCDKTIELIENKVLDSLLNPKQTTDLSKIASFNVPENIENFDLVVIGGGSGGNACAKEAASHGAKVCVLDFVKPSPAGTTWGYGGTCVNVGCIPKKMMHQAALIGEYMKDATAFGYDIDREKIKHDWSKLVSAVNDHIHSLNFKYRLQLRKAKITYKNEFAEFIDNNRIKCTNANGNESFISAENIVIACGGRPQYPDIPGAREYGITSDDIFWLSYYPGKTLIVGASYIALECAGFLHEIGCDVTVMVRSIFLRGFDQQIANKIGDYMDEMGVKFIRTTIPERIECIEKGNPSKLRVHYKHVKTGEMGSEEFNTVIFAMGRKPFLDDLHLERTDVLINPINGKIITMNEKTKVPHIFGLGDCVHENRQILSKPLELTPVAIKAGINIAKRLFGEYNEKVDYTFVPTTVFTPIEYGSVGLSEDDARSLYKDRIEVYHNEIIPFEWAIPHRPQDACYIKIVVLKSTDKDKNSPKYERVIGFHYLGPFGGEVTQGFALALKMGSTKKDFDDLIGIHPTCAESFTKMSISKSSGVDAAASGC